MLNNYFRIAFRGLIKNKTFSAITILGLSVGVTAFLCIIHYVRFEKSYEDFHVNAPNITRVTLDFYHGSEYVVTDCETHPGVGPILKEKMPEVRDFVRMMHNDGLQDIKVGSQKFLEEGIYYADQSVFKIFSLNLLQGKEKEALIARNQVVISESIAMKFFGRTDVVGEPIEIHESIYHISGVMKDIPLNTHLKFSILLSHATLYNEWYKDDSWEGNNEYTYLLMTPGYDLKAFNQKLSAWSLSMKDKQLNGSRYSAQPMKDIHLYSNKTFEPEANGSSKVVYFLIAIAAFIILIAWVNYINLSTARAMERAREVGIRKVMGSFRIQLIFQFLAESFVINTCSVVISILLFQFLLPAFRNLTGQPFSMYPLTDHFYWYLIAGLIFIGTILSGLYPAFVLSAFKPVSVLKGKFQSSTHGQLLRKSLVVFQFSATIVLIIAMTTVYLQSKYLQNFDLGADIKQTMVIRAPRLNVSDSVFKSSFQAMKTELLKNPQIKDVTRSGSLPGISLHELSSTTLARASREKRSGGDEVYFYSIDSDFISAMGMTLKAGRNFENGSKNDDQVIVNEEAIKRLGFKNPDEAIGTKITFKTRSNGEPSTIIGVLKSFYQRSPKEAHLPMLFYYSDRPDYLSLKLNTSNIHGSIENVKKVFSELYPDNVFSYFFLDDHFAKQFEAEVKFGKVMAVFSGLAVFIACLGLFGLSSYTIVQRTKEIGIRKVLGASVGEVVGLLSKDFTKVIAIAACFAIPIAWFGMRGWLSNYAVRISLNVWIFIFPVVAILLIALMTVSFQTIKTALSNPVKALKQE